MFNKCRLMNTQPKGKRSLTQWSTRKIGLSLIDYPSQPAPSYPIRRNEKLSLLYGYEGASNIFGIWQLHNPHHAFKPPSPPADVTNQPRPDSAIPFSRPQVSCHGAFPDCILQAYNYLSEYRHTQHCAANGIAICKAIVAILVTTLKRCLLT